MAAPTISLPYQLTAINIAMEIEERRALETDFNRWRMLDQEYLMVLGSSVLVRHSMQVAVWQGVHPRIILVSISSQICYNQPKFQQYNLEQFLDVPRLARIGRALYFRFDAMEIDEGLCDQVS